MVSNRDAGTRVLKAVVDKLLVIDSQLYQLEDVVKGRSYAPAGHTTPHLL